MTRSSMLFVIGMLSLFAGTAARKPWHQAVGAFVVLVAFWLAPD